MRIGVLATVLSAILLVSGSPFETNATRHWCIQRPPGDHGLIAHDQQVLSLGADSFMRDPAQCLAKGKGIWSAISNAKADTPHTQTTDKFVASYAELFQDKTITTKPNKKDENKGNEILSALNLKTVNGARLNKPLIPNLPGSLGYSQGVCAYELAFAPGLIAAVYSFKEDDTVPQKQQVNWDVIAMELYKRYRGTASPKDLKYVLRFYIANSDTIGVLEKLYREHKMKNQITAQDTDWVKWDPEDSRELEAVQMMLGTDNGSGAGYMLIDYKSTLEKSGIAAIHTRRSGGKWHMATEFA